jgi:uncharacterized protein YegL
MSLKDHIEIPKAVNVIINVYFIIDISENMLPKIDSINLAMKETVMFLINTTKTFDINLAVMSFSSNTKWHTNGLVNIDNYDWHDLNAGGICDLGKAFNDFFNAISNLDEW